MKNRSVKASLKKRATADTSEIKLNVKGFLDNRKNVNKLLDVVAQLQNEDDAHILAAIRGLHKVFTTVIQLSEMTSPRPVKDVDESNLTPEEKYIIWLQETYRDVISELLLLMSHENQAIQELSLCSLMKLVAEEGAHPIVQPSDERTFPTQLFKKILTRLLRDDQMMVKLIERSQEFMDHDDVRGATMNHLMDVMRQNSGQVPETQRKNAFALLQVLSMPDDKEDRQPSFMVTSSAGNVKLDMKHQRRQYGNVWIEFLKNKLSVNQYKQVLVMLHDKVMPHMANPVSLCDFLTHAYNMGGAISLLALNGLFVLMQKHHLNYPDFYTKLYALMDDTVLHVKYRARFFYLTDLFLTSTHIPAYLVAAFIKRLSRLSLTAPTDSLLFVLPFIYNLMIRHPNTRILIHGTDEKEVDSDPYLPDEVDPSKCEALNSSLWELKTSQMHHHPDVASMARKMNKNLPEREYDLSGRLDTKYQDLLEGEPELDKVHLAYTPVTGLFSDKDDACGELWAVE